MLRISSSDDEYDADDNYDDNDYDDEEFDDDEEEEEERHLKYKINTPCKIS